MTALIIYLAAWLQREAIMCALPSPIDTALDHVVWLRLTHPDLKPRAAGEALGLITMTWADVVRAYAEAWEAIPEHVRNGTNP